MGAGKKVAVNVFVDGTLYLAGEVPSKEHADQISNPKVWGETPGKAGKDDAGGDAGGLPEMKVDDLKAEIAKRNEGRDDADKVSDKGTKAELLAALKADDAKSA